MIRDLVIVSLSQFLSSNTWSKALTKNNGPSLGWPGTTINSDDKELTKFKSCSLQDTTWLLSSLKKVSK